MVGGAGLEKKLGYLDIVVNGPTTFLPNQEVEDEVIWTLTKNEQNSPKLLGSPLDQPVPTVGWYNLVSFNHHFPRWAVISWLSFRESVSNKNRLVKTWISYNSACVPHSDFKENSLTPVL